MNKFAVLMSTPWRENLFYFLRFGIVKEVYMKALELIPFDSLVYLLGLLQNIPHKHAQICFSPAHFPPPNTNN